MQCKNLKISSVTHFQYPTKHLTSEPHFQLDDTAERNLCCWHYWNIAAWPQGGRQWLVLASICNRGCSGTHNHNKHVPLASQ